MLGCGVADGMDVAVTRVRVARTGVCVGEIRVLVAGTGVDVKGSRVAAWVPVGNTAFDDGVPTGPVPAAGARIEVGVFSTIEGGTEVGALGCTKLVSRIVIWVTVIACWMVDCTGAGAA